MGGYEDGCLPWSSTRRSPPCHRVLHAPWTPCPASLGGPSRELDFATLPRTRRSRATGRSPVVRSSDRGLLAALGILFALFVGAIFVLAPAGEVAEVPWTVGGEEPGAVVAPGPEEAGSFERIQLFAGSVRGVPEGLPGSRVSVRGRVRTRTGAAVAGATIHAGAGSAEGAAAWAVDLPGPHRSLGDGFFSFDAEVPTPCVLVLHVQHPDHPPASFVRNLESSIPDLDVGYLVLDSGASAEGRVVGPDGMPLAGARVRLLPLMESPAALKDVAGTFFAARVATTDRSGGYRLDRIVPGDWMLEAAADGHQTRRTSGFTLMPGPDQQLELVVLPRARSLRVQVVGPDGLPVDVAEVRAVEPRTGRVHAATRTGAGEHVVDGLSDGPVDLEAFAPGFRRTFQRGTETDSPSVVRLQLARGLAVRGRVTDTAGRPVEHFTVAVLPDEGAGAAAERMEREARTQRRVLFQRMRELAATVEGRTEVMRLLQQEDARLAEQAAQREALLGATADANALASLRLPEAPAPTHWPNGAYEVGGLEDGRVQLVFLAPGLAPLWSDPFDLAGEDMIADVEFDAGRILQGNVRDSSGQPVAGASVRAFPRDRGVEAAMRMVASAVAPVVTGQDGSFTLRGVCDGNWQLVATSDESVPVLGETLLVDADRSGILLQVRRHGSLEGRVGIAPGAAALEVVAVPAVADASQGAIRSGAVGPDGRYRIDGLGPGPHVVRLLHVPSRSQRRTLLEQVRSGSVPADVVVAEGTVTPLDFGAPAPPGAVLSGIVHDAGRPARGLVVAVRVARPEAGEPDRLVTVAETGLDPEGRFRVEDLPSGEVEVLVQLPRSGAAVLSSRTCTLMAGTEQTLFLEVATCQLHGTVMLPDGMDATGLRARLVRAGDATVHEVTMAAGEFRFDRVPAGEWQLVVEKPGLRHAQSVRLEPGFRNEAVVDATAAGTRLRARSAR